MILHDLNLAARYCDRLLLLKNGRAQIAGAPDEVLREGRCKPCSAWMCWSSGIRNEVTPVIAR